MKPEPPVDPNVAMARYQGAAGRAYHQSKREIPPPAFPWVARLRAGKLAPWVRPEDTVLEFGVGLGWNLAALQCRRRLGFDVAGFVASELRERGIEFVPRTQNLPTGAANVVICHHTLEHVMDPPGVLAEIHRLLRPDGRLLLFVPYERERRYRRFRPDEPNHHLYSWNVQTLGNLVQDTGFKVQTAGVGRFGYDRFAAVWACRLGLGELGFRCIRWMAHAVFPAWEVQLVALRPNAASTPEIRSSGREPDARGP
jgi:SAM-dependent methyltransferase